MDGHMVRREKRREAYRILVDRPKGKKIEVIGAYGRIILKCVFSK
jgi:hypothetical protein